MYCCGPTELISELERVCAFEVVLKRTGRTLVVGPRESILEAARAAGAEVPSSCEQGFCGSCETPVIEGSRTIETPC